MSTVLDAIDAVERIKKFLSGLGKKRHVQAHEALRVSLGDLRAAETKAGHLDKDNFQPPVAASVDEILVDDPSRREHSTIRSFWGHFFLLFQPVCAGFPACGRRIERFAIQRSQTFWACPSPESPSLGLAPLK
ncbi:hypothetical protein HD554DRAFT_582085 [Boletus coccyginus]|nr:hypothetical protein HD554DRAFT_582085 [Boletus coccyginus]